MSAQGETDPHALQVNHYSQSGVHLRTAEEQHICRSALAEGCRQQVLDHLLVRRTQQFTCVPRSTSGTLPSRQDR
jgi:hypothetical protein